MGNSSEAIFYPLPLKALLGKIVFLDELWLRRIGSGPRQPFDQENDICSRCLLRMEMQLMLNGDNFGTILLLKDLKRSSMNNYTLKRVENLRRSVIDALGKIENNKIQTH